MKIKTYKNILNRALKLWKRSHYHNVLQEHKGNSKKIWEIVNELTYTKKRSWTVPSKLINKDGIVIINHQTIAHKCNKYFVNVKKAVACFNSLQ